MKRIISLFLAALLCLIIMPVGAFAEEGNDDLAVIETTEVTLTETETILSTEDSVINTVEPSEDCNVEETYTLTPASDGETIVLVDSDDPVDTENDASQPSADNETEEASPSEAEIVDEEEPTDPDEYVISGEDIEIGNGIYSYKLVVRKTGEMIFDNDLEIYYQGVNGCYTLHYEITETDNHIMIVTGSFDNIMVASPLLKAVSDRISEDSYYYQLDLRTQEGFTFANKLQYLFDGDKHGYTIDYGYDKTTGKQIFDIDKLSD